MTVPYTFGTTDVSAGRAEAAKLEGKTLRVPSPGTLEVRLCPPWRAGLKLPYHEWTIHYGFRVEGYQPTHVCLRSLGQSYCPGCKATSKLYDLSKQRGDAAHEAASDIRSSTRFMYNVISGIQRQRFMQNNQNILVTDTAGGEPRIQVYSANDQVHQTIWRFMADFGDFTDPFTGHDVQLHRQASGQQKAEYAPTQLYVIPDASVVSERILNTMNAGMPELDKFYEITELALFETIAMAYFEAKCQAMGLATGTHVSMPGGVGPAPIPAGVPAPPSPTFRPPVGINPPGVGVSAPPPSGYTAAPAPSNAAAPASPAAAPNENPYKALVPANDPRIVQGHKVPDCFGRYEASDRDCQACGFSNPECMTVTSQINAGQKPSLAPQQVAQPAQPVATGRTPAVVTPAQAPAQAPAPQASAAPAMAPTPGGPAVNAAALESLEASLTGGQPKG